MLDLTGTSYLAGVQSLHNCPESFLYSFVDDPFGKNVSTGMLAIYFLECGKHIVTIFTKKSIRKDQLLLYKKWCLMATNQSHVQFKLFNCFRLFA